MKPTYVEITFVRICRWDHARLKGGNIGGIKLGARNLPSIMHQVSAFLGPESLDYLACCASLIQGTDETVHFILE